MYTHSTQKNADGRVRQMVITALLICLVVLGTLMFRIPIPMTQGYIHLGDTMIYLAVLLLGRKSAAAAAGVGSAMADILGGFAFWAPWSFIIKFAMAYTAGLILDMHSKKHCSPAGMPSQIGAMTAGGSVMCIGYLVAERVMYGSWAAAAIAVPWNIGQFAAGIALSLIISRALSGIPVFEEFQHR